MTEDTSADLIGRARMLIDSGAAAAAIGLLDGALAGYPRSDELWMLRGAAFGRLTKTEESLRCFEKALELNPLNETALYNSAEAKRFLGDHQGALLALQKGLELFPNNPTWLFRLWWSERQIALWNDRENSICEQMLTSCRLAEVSPLSRGVPDPFSSLLLPLSETLRLTVASAYAKQVQESVKHVAREGRPEVGRHKKIRVAFLSADFHEHATMFLALEAIEALDASQFDRFFFSFGPAKEDDARRRLRACGIFEDVAACSDIELAQKIADQDIDVLVDLKGYTAFARPAVLAIRPAAIQVQWLGYPGSLGAPWIDWVIADQTVIPQAGGDKHITGFSERVLYLPHSYQPNNSIRWERGNRVSRGEFGLPEESVVLANFNSPYKLDRNTWNDWMAILRAAPQAVLWQLADNELTRNNLLREANASGVNASQIIFAEQVPHAQHIERLALADLALDPYAMGGHTTTSDALRAGLPVLTLMGDTFGTRVCASLLHAIGLPELIFFDRDTLYIACIGLINNPKERATLRQYLFEQRLISPLFSSEEFARNLGRAFATMVDLFIKEDDSRTGIHIASDEKEPTSNWLNLAQEYLEKEDFPKVEKKCLTALRKGTASSLSAKHSNRTNALSLYALALYRQQKYESAALVFQVVVQRYQDVSAPNLAQIQHNLASSLESMGCYVDAERTYLRSLKLDARRIDTLSQFGTMLRNLGRLDEALAIHSQAISLDPKNRDIQYVYAGTQYQAGNIEVAEKLLWAIVQSNPKHAEAQANLGICQLLRGEFRLGWRNFEARWQTSCMKNSWAPFSARTWAGESLENKVLLVWAEQGLGDNIQFARYLALVRKRHPTSVIIFWLPKTLKRLFEEFSKRHSITLFAREDLPQPSMFRGLDFHCPIMSLPRFFTDDIESIPSQIPAYIRISQDEKDRWIKELARFNATSQTERQRPLNVGLVWSGQVEGEMSIRRNVNPKTLEVLLSVPNIRWFSLQFGDKQREQINGTKWETVLVDLTGSCRDFLDTAAYANALDMVISVDTSTAHVSAAMEVPVWLLSRFDGCWRWLEGREDSPWYPTMRIWRQNRHLDWEDVCYRVTKALKEFECNRTQQPRRGGGCCAPLF